MRPFDDILVCASLPATVRSLRRRAPFAELVGDLKGVVACSKRLHLLVSLGLFGRHDRVVMVVQCRRMISGGVVGRSFLVNKRGDYAISRDLSRVEFVGGELAAPTALSSLLRKLEIQDGDAERRACAFKTELVEIPSEMERCRICQMVAAWVPPHLRG